MSKELYDLCQAYCESWREIRKNDGEPMVQFPIAINLKNLELKLMNELVPFGADYGTVEKMEKALKDINKIVNTVLEEIK